MNTGDIVTFRGHWGSYYDQLRTNLVAIIMNQRQVRAYCYCLRTFVLLLLSIWEKILHGQAIIVIFLGQMVAIIMNQGHIRGYS